MNQQILDHAFTGLSDLKNSGNFPYGCDLHNRLFNEDYFVIGYYNAEQFINECGGAFAVIREIQDYEKMNFGECYTDFSNSEKVANIYAYIQGEILLSHSEILQDKWNKYLDESDIEAIIEELKEEFE